MCCPPTYPGPPSQAPHLPPFHALIPPTPPTLARNCPHHHVLQVPVLLPTLLAILDDPSPSVSRHGAWALHHLCSEALPSGRDSKLKRGSGSGGPRWSGVRGCRVLTLLKLNPAPSPRPGTNLLVSDLLWQRELLIDTVRRMVVGCDEALWSAALPASIATIRALEVRREMKGGSVCVCVCVCVCERERERDLLSSRSRPRAAHVLTASFLSSPPPLLPSP